METHNNNLNNNIYVTVPVLRQLIELYQNADQTGKEDIKIWADYSLHWAVRRLEAFLSKARVSIEAAKKADKMKIGDISTYKWNDQTRKRGMRDPKRKIFHYEHIHPVAELCRELKTLNPITDEDILKIINKVDIAWITKDECKKLGSHGKAKDTIPHIENFKRNSIKFI